MAHAAHLLRSAIRSASDRYELRADFEHDVYSVAHASKDSLSLDFLAGKFRAETDPRAGSKTLSDILTLTRPDPATYRDSSGVLQTAASDEPRIHHPAPWIVSSLYEDDFSSYADEAAAEANGWTHDTSPDGWTFDAANARWSLSGAAMGQRSLRLQVIGMTEGTRFRALVLTSGVSGGNVFVRPEGIAATQSPAQIADGYAITDVQEVFGSSIIIEIFGVAGTQANIERVLIQEMSHADGEQAGLLLEPESTNLCAHSSVFSSWNVNNFPVLTPGARSGPRGPATMTRLEIGTDGLRPRIRKQAIGLGPGGVVSLYAAAGESSVIRFGTDTSGNNTAQFDLRTGEWISIGNNIVGYAAELEEDGVYRIWVACSGGNAMVVWSEDTGDGTYTAGNGLYIDGAQAELGEIPTSLIETDGSPVVRAKDEGVIDLGLAEAREYTFSYRALMGLTFLTLKGEIGDSLRPGIHGASNGFYRFRPVDDNNSQITTEYVMHGLSADEVHDRKFAVTIGASEILTAVDTGDARSSGMSRRARKATRASIFGPSTPTLLRQLRFTSLPMTADELAEEVTL